MDFFSSFLGMKKLNLWAIKIIVALRMTSNWITAGNPFAAKCVFPVL